MWVRRAVGVRSCLVRRALGSGGRALGSGGAHHEDVREHLLVVLDDRRLQVLRELATSLDELGAESLCAPHGSTEEEAKEEEECSHTAARVPSTRKKQTKRKEMNEKQVKER